MAATGSGAAERVSERLGRCEPARCVYAFAESALACRQVFGQSVALRPHEKALAGLGAGEPAAGESSVAG